MQELLLNLKNHIKLKDKLLERRARIIHFFSIDGIIQASKESHDGVFLRNQCFHPSEMLNAIGYNKATVERNFPTAYYIKVSDSHYDYTQPRMIDWLEKDEIEGFVVLIEQAGVARVDEKGKPVEFIIGREGEIRIDHVDWVYGDTKETLIEAIENWSDECFGKDVCLMQKRNLRKNLIVG